MSFRSFRNLYYVAILGTGPRMTAILGASSTTMDDDDGEATMTEGSRSARWLPHQPNQTDQKIIPAKRT